MEPEVGFLTVCRAAILDLPLVWRVRRLSTTDSLRSRLRDGPCAPVWLDPRLLVGSGALLLRPPSAGYVHDCSGRMASFI